MLDLTPIKERAVEIANCDTCGHRSYGRHGKLVKELVRTDVPALCKEVERLREALPDPAKLEMLAEWFDRHDADLGYADTAVQDDLRAWAAAARRTLTEARSALSTPED